MSSSPKIQSRPLVILTGAAGNIGRALAAALGNDYRVAGLDIRGDEDWITECDLTSRHSVRNALREVVAGEAGKIASVVHLAAYFDFTGEDNPLYEQVNVEGTRNLLAALQEHDVGQFVYSGTMLVHKPGEPGLPITEQTELEPAWAYPRSKAEAEAVIREEHGDIPYVLLHIAGLYDERTAVPTLTHQIARIHRRSVKSHLYSGSGERGQAFVHRDDLIDAVHRTVDRRAELPKELTLLVGEPDTVSYDVLQRLIATQLHDARRWPTLQVPKFVAAAGSWLQIKSEPVVPDDLDQGEEPFVRPFMTELADDHYELDIARAGDLLGWKPKHAIRNGIVHIIDALKSDAKCWYAENGIVAPPWVTEASKGERNPETMRYAAEENFRATHQANLWAPLANMGLGAWLLTSPPLLGYGSGWLAVSDMVVGILIVVLAFMTLSWRFALLRWAVAALGLWVMVAPLLLWTSSAAAYLNGTLVGALVFGFAVAVRPVPGIGIVASQSGPTIPPGWDYSPSGWFQRAPIILLALVGLFISRYLAAYQLGHIDTVWEPFFAGSAEDPQNGTEEIITSSVSEAWPVPDAGLGALVYLLEILTGLIGSARRWRTMPWLVVLFGIMIVPLGVVSITFIVIQPIVLGTWCTLCLIAAAAMTIQIPYSVDELVATGQFLMRRKREGRPILRIFFTGDTDEGDDSGAAIEDNFAQRPDPILREMAAGGIGVTWSLAASVLLGIWLMFSRIILGSEGLLADAEHLIGALAITVAVTAMAEVARAVRFFNTALGAALAIVAVVADATLVQMAVNIVAGIMLIALSIPRGCVRNRYGRWNWLIV